jgi:hypothetical protein
MIKFSITFFETLKIYSFTEKVKRKHRLFLLVISKYLYFCRRKHWYILCHNTAFIDNVKIINANEFTPKYFLWLPF